MRRPRRGHLTKRPLVCLCCEGWICELEVSDASQFDEMLDAAAYVELVEG